jgi:hypothetical protein
MLAVLTKESDTTKCITPTTMMHFAKIIRSFSLVDLSVIWSLVGAAVSAREIESLGARKMGIN